MKQVKKIVGHAYLVVPHVREVPLLVLSVPLGPLGRTRTPVIAQRYAHSVQGAILRQVQVRLVVLRVVLVSLGTLMVLLPVQIVPGDFSRQVLRRNVPNVLVDPSHNKIVQ